MNDSDSLRTDVVFLQDDEELLGIDRLNHADDIGILVEVDGPFTPRGDQNRRACGVREFLLASEEFPAMTGISMSRMMKHGDKCSTRQARAFAPFVVMIGSKPSSITRVAIEEQAARR
jgi:hypothetical protein